MPDACWELLLESLQIDPLSGTVALGYRGQICSEPPWEVESEMSDILAEV